VVAVARIAAAL